MSSTKRTDPSRWQAIAKKLESIKSREDIPEEYLHFRAQCALAYARAHSTLDGSTATPPEQVKTDVAPSQPLELSDLQIDVQVLRELFDDLIKALSKRTPENSEISKLGERIEQRPEELEAIAALAIYRWDQTKLKRLATKLGVHHSSMLLLGRMLGAPMVARAAQKLTPQDNSAQENGACPVCLSPPGFAHLRHKDGQRFLTCSVCEHEYAYPRLRCPFCQNEDQETMNMILLSESDPRWLEVCERCRRYTKTLDARRLPASEQFDPYVEETLTVGLDLLAEREGYVRWIL